MFFVDRQVRENRMNGCVVLRGMSESAARAAQASVFDIFRMSDQLMQAEGIYCLNGKICESGIHVFSYA
jgi:hypothetical protein